MGTKFCVCKFDEDDDDPTKNNETSLVCKHKYITKYYPFSLVKTNKIIIIKTLQLLKKIFLIKIVFLTIISRKFNKLHSRIKRKK